MSAFNELYQPTELDDELFLSSVPLSLLEEGIKKQFDNPLDYRKTDYVQTFISRYNFSIENMREEEENTIEDMHDEFIQFMKTILYETLGIGFDNIEDKSVDDQHQLIHYVYRFFITNIKKNFVNLIMNYIERNKDDIRPILVKTKDIIYRNFKPEIEDEYYVLVLSNLSTVISHILSEDFDVDSFLDYVTGEDSDILETEYMKSKMDDFEVTGNFVSSYVGMIDKFFRLSLENKIRKEILSKFPNRKKEYAIDDE